MPVDAPRLGRTARDWHLSALVAWGLVGLAAAIRFHDLATKSFWFDEFLTARVTRFATLDELSAWIQRWIDHPPLHVFLTWLLRPLGGDEFAVRAPVAVAGTLAVGAMYSLGRALAGPRVGLVAAGILAVMPYAVWYSQEARPYEFLLLWTIVQMWCAHRAVSTDRPGAWAALAAVTVANLYTSFLALIPTAAAFLFVVARATRWPRRTNAPAWAPSEHMLASRFAVHALATWAFVAIAYVPWTPFLVMFLSRSDLGAGRLDTSHVAQLDELGALLQAVSLGDALVIGLMVVGAIWVGRCLRQPNGSSLALLGVWLAVGVGGFLILARGGIVTVWPRYFMELVPAGVLLVAIGLDALAIASATIASRISGQRSTAAFVQGVVTAALIFGLFLPAPTRLAELYETPKGEDYRGAAMAIATGEQAGSVVLAIGQSSDWLIEGLAHELWLARSTITAADGATLDSPAVSALSVAPAVLFAELVPSADRPRTPSPANWSVLEVRGIRLVRPTPEAGFAAAKVGLDWAAARDDRLRDSDRLLVALLGPPASWRNVLQEATDAVAPSWSLPDGTSFVNGEVRVHPVAGQLDATLTIRAGGPATAMAFVFSCRSELAGGSLSVYVSSHSRAGDWLSIAPTGAGYRCPNNSGFVPGGFLVTLPEGTDHLIVRVRGEGRGSADVRDLRLFQLPS
jgi:4-amino-4-deoxy-L-arabinose transferase-like glycosyltransferase